MTKNTIGIFIVLCAMVLFTSCSHKMVGTWTVQRYETTTPGEQSVALTNIGTMHFKKNGTGTKNLSYSVLGINRNDHLPFNWLWNDSKYMTITSNGSDFAKTWIIVSNKKRFQQWKSTDGGNNIQILELRK